jgi:radical SAM protein with 4Fe4S-binding SPASM domain
VRSFRSAGMEVGVCTNATTLDQARIRELARLGVHCNVSLDGFAADSHGKFRGDRASFQVTVDTVRRLGAAGILQGLLCTPNSLAQNQEYAELCAFARQNGARYVLLNPLGSMGRGVRSKDKLAKSTLHMQEIYELTAPFEGPDLDVAHIRFPNTDGKPLAGCEAGTIIYVFTPGEVTVCPYLVFAARTPASRHPDTDFIVGNIFTDPDIAQRLDDYRFHDRYQVGDNPTCGACTMNASCGKGCPAAVIAAGGRIGDLDAEQCPVVDGTAPVGRRLLPLTPR